VIRFLLALSLSFVHSLSAPCVEEQLQFGVGMIHLNMHHYRGSDETIQYNFPFPYVFYQSEKIMADSAMINGKFFTSSYLTVQLSMNFSPAVESKQNTARLCMEKLNYMFGVGPLATFHLYDEKRLAINFEMALRQETETDFNYTAFNGQSGALFLSFRLRPEKLTDMSGELAIGQLYASQKLHAYYFDVTEDEVTANRSFYKGHAGNSGKTVLFFVRKQFEKILVMPYLRYDDLSEAVFRDSPLVKQSHYLMFGVGLFYMLI
jgi:MipA family protein